MLYPTNNATLQILHPYLDKVVEKVEVQKAEKITGCLRQGSTEIYYRY